MRKSRFTEEQIAYAMKQAEAGALIAPDRREQYRCLLRLRWLSCP